MSIKRETPCDYLKDENGMAVCPYITNQWDHVHCEYWCGAEEPADVPEEWEEENDAASY